MKNLVLALVVCLISGSAVLADELKINIGVESGERKTEVVAADVYAFVDGKPVEITVAPENLAFKMNLKAGAFRLKSFWLTEAKLRKIAE